MPTKDPRYSIRITEDMERRIKSRKTYYVLNYRIKFLIY